MENETAQEPLQISPWMRGVLLLAFGYNLLWGIFISQFPNSFFQWLRGSDLPAPELVTYQGYGVLILAILYFTLAIYPARFWYLTLAGALSKIVGALGVWIWIMDQTTTKKFLFHIIFNDLVWVPVLLVIAYRGWQINKNKPATASS